MLSLRAQVVGVCQAENQECPKCSQNQDHSQYQDSHCTGNLVGKLSKTNPPQLLHDNTLNAERCNAASLKLNLDADLDQWVHDSRGKSAFLSVSLDGR